MSEICHRLQVDGWSLQTTRLLTRTKDLWTIQLENTIKPQQIIALIPYLLRRYRITRLLSDSYISINWQLWTKSRICLVPPCNVPIRWLFNVSDLLYILNVFEICQQLLRAAPAFRRCVVLTVGGQRRVIDQPPILRIPFILTFTHYICPMNWISDRFIIQRRLSTSAILDHPLAWLINVLKHMLIPLPIILVLAGLCFERFRP